jgi:hypothetical protein
MAWATEGGSTASVIVVPLHPGGGRLPDASTRLRVRLRRLRDNKVPTRWRYRDVAMTGIVVTDVAAVVIRHTGISVSQIEMDLVRPVQGRITSIGAVAAMRWPLGSADAVAVAIAGRGIERMRFRIGPRRPPTACRHGEWAAEPMPILII